MSFLYSVTLDDPTEDGTFEWISLPALNRYTGADYLYWGKFPSLPQMGAPGIARSYVEWDISSIPLDAIITLVKFKYHGKTNDLSTDDGYIYAMAVRPSTGTDQDVYDDCADGTAYYTGKVFPEVGATKEVDLGVAAVADLQAALGGWFAIGLSTDEVTEEEGEIYPEEYATVNPKPTLYVEYTLPSVPVADGDLIGIPIIRKS